MCNCGGKKKKRPAGSPEPVFSRASLLADDDPLLTEKVPVSLVAHIEGRAQVDIFMDDGKKRTLALRTGDTIDRHLKLRAMQRAPKLFLADDPDWQYVGNDERAGLLFQGVMAE